MPVTSSYSPTSCPLNNLLPELKLEILKQLEFREYRNLAFTCRLWYKTASTAPKHVKPTVVSTELLIHSQSILHPDYSPDFSLINKWKCRYLTIRNHRLSFLKFVEKHQQIFDIGCIVIEMPILFEEVVPVTYALVKLASEVVLSNLSGRSIYSYKTPKVDFRFYITYFHSEVIIDYNSLTMFYITKVLEQWVQNKRPNLQYFMAKVDEPMDLDDMVTLDNITTNIREFVMDRSIENVDDVIREHAKIVVPGLPTMFVCTFHDTLVLSRSSSDDNPSIMKEIESRLHERATCDEGVYPNHMRPFNINYL